MSNGSATEVRLTHLEKGQADHEGRLRAVERTVTRGAVIAGVVAAVAASLISTLLARMI